jgi:hypothetical protein
MFDLYHLPTDFPGFDDACKEVDPYQRVKVLEEKLMADQGSTKLLPYIQLHEFESLILVDPTTLHDDFPAHGKQIRSLLASIKSKQPELINDGETTAPSKRIIAKIPEYGARKREVGPKAVARIGLQKVRSACPHFHQWLERLESLAQNRSTH